MQTDQSRRSAGFTAGQPRGAARYTCQLCGRRWTARESRQLASVQMRLHQPALVPDNGPPSTQLHCVAGHITIVPGSEDGISRQPFATMAAVLTNLYMLLLSDL